VGPHIKNRYHEVTYRKGKPLAAHLYLPRELGAKAARRKTLGTVSELTTTIT
jgi:hypothetical protein